GFAVRKPLARVPENTMKFVVGVMLTSFGIFWGAEGAGAQWPGADAALLAVVGCVALVSLGLVGLLRNLRRRREPVAVSGVTGAVGHSSEAGSPRVEAVGVSPDSSPHPELAHSGDRPRRRAADRLVAFGVFWYDFIFGDDWQVTVGIVIAFALTFWLSTAGLVSWWLTPTAVLLVLLPYGLMRAVRNRS
ncbi:MAG: hypothetical protein ACYCZK_08995, partial [Microbacteriaceae bacterium]